jgi:hypothetical protein
MTIPSAIAGALATDGQIWSDFLALCDCGGRLAGTSSEAAALAWLREAGVAATGRAVVSVPAPYAGWRAEAASVTLLDGDRRVPLACLPLVRSSSGTVEAEVVDVGRGTEAEFLQVAASLAGRIALVRHEYIGVSNTMRRCAPAPAAF